MKLLVSEPGRMVLHLTADERHGLRTVLHASEGIRRKAPPLTRGDATGLPEDAAALMEESVLAGIVWERLGSVSLLEDPGHCKEGKGGYGLELTEAEAEGFLRALNGARVAFWEALGSPDFEAGERVEPTDANRAIVALMELAGAWVARWLACTSGEDGTGD